MISYEYAELFTKDNVQKQLIIDYDGGQITNNRIYSEAFELKESLCSQSELRFGSCEASVLKLKARNEFGILKNKWLDVSMILDGNADIPFQFGRYKVYSDEPSGDRKYTNITAYDAMYDIINAEMVEWYDGLEFPISMKDFRDSFFTYFGITQVETTLIQDEVMLEKTIDADSISGKKIITAICELNGVFGHINRQGDFEYVSLERKIEYSHPSSNTYPSPDTYPGMIWDLEYTKHDIPSNLYQSCEYEDFETRYITKLQIRQEENDIGAVYGNGTNCYIVEDNFLVYGKTADELSKICTRLFGKICGVQYRPFKAVAKGNPCFEVGDLVNVQAKYKDIEGYILERTIKGIQALKDTFEAKGVYEYKEKVNSVQRDIKKLKGKTNVLERTVEKLESTITDEETGLQTQIKQTSEKVEVMAGDDYVSSKLSVEKGKIKIEGNRLIVNSDNFKLDEDGNLSISGRYEVECVRTYYASDYTEADMERVKAIIVDEITATEQDYKKYDFYGDGINARSYLVVQKFMLGINEWAKYRQSIVIDPSKNMSLIKAALYLTQSSTGIETLIGETLINGDNVSTGEATARCYNTSNGKQGTTQSVSTMGLDLEINGGIITDVTRNFNERFNEGSSNNTGEYWITGKPIYRRTFVTTTELVPGTNWITHGIENIENIWIDMGNSFIENANGITYPVAFSQYSTGVDALTAYVDKEKIYFNSQTSWGTTWEKIITVRYTLTTDASTY